MSGSRTIEGLEGLEALVDSREDAIRLVQALRLSLRIDVDRLSERLQAGEREEAILLVHRMLGALCLFEPVPGFAAIQDIVDAMRSSDLGRVATDWPGASRRLLAFVDALERRIRSGPA